jgi:hypothetical protein
MTVKGRAASGPMDKSLAIGDFAAGAVTGRYQQFLITVTSGGTATPVILGVNPKSQ